ncbi:unnamed protein product [Ectocarpus sp. 6 AP-2014]
MKSSIAFTVALLSLPGGTAFVLSSSRSDHSAMRRYPTKSQPTRHALLSRVASQRAPDSAAEGVVPDSQTLSEVLAAAVHAASEAGALMKAKVGADVLKTKFNPKDLLTEVDGQCQRVIEKVVSKQFPDHALLGEENVEPGAEASTVALSDALDGGGAAEWLWVVDPIDGTTNFVHGIPLSAVSIGVAYRGKVVVGCIYDPFRDELFTATSGNGAFLNGMKMKVGDQETIGEAAVACGAPPGVLALGPCVRGMAALAPHVRTTRMLGSAAIMLAWVACGRLTCYWEPDLNSWDIAAGALLIQEAGGEMTDILGGPYSLSTRAIIGSNKLVHEEIRHILVEAKATRPDSTPQL